MAITLTFPCQNKWFRYYKVWICGFVYSRSDQPEQGCLHPKDPIIKQCLMLLHPQIPLEKLLVKNVVISKRNDEQNYKNLLKYSQQQFNIIVHRFFNGFVSSSTTLSYCVIFLQNPVSILTIQSKL